MSTVSEFDADTAVARVAPDAYTAVATDRWNVGSVPNGGYAMAIAQRALLARLDRPDPLSVTAHFLRPMQPGGVALAAEIVKAGRSTATGMVRLVQDGSERLRLLGTATDLTGSDRGLVHHTSGPPDLPPPEDCPRGSGEMPGGAARAALGGRFDLRVHPDHAGWARGEPTGQLEIAGWIRPADGREPDVLLLPVVVDAFPPTVFELGITGWVPTLELTLHVRARPAPGWLRCVIRSRYVSGGLVEEDAEVWDAQDRLVALSRQVARVPRPRR